ncbi:MAG: N-acetylneuraminate synthase family protein [Verrucomicrobiota bacterium]|nr:N-acetylneuraminate synthase family protein [Verrucomicrobiota bacterium]
MTRQLIIEHKEINDHSDCYVIAEIGHNHMGKLEVAKELFKTAKDCGVDAVKLQKRDNKGIYTKALYNQIYDNPNSYGDTYGAHREALEFGYAEYKELQTLAKDLGLAFFSTAFDFKSADFLAELDLPAFKIASGDLKNLPLLKYVAKFKKPMIISTGGAQFEDIKRAYYEVMAINPQLAILQCTAAYPCQFDELNLRVITNFREQFPGSVIGLSDHDNGIAMSVAAYVLGARIVEKHFTLNRANKGTDHAFSLEPIGMKKMVRDLRRTRLALGDGIKRTYPSEVKPLMKMAKSIKAARDLQEGHLLAADDLAFKSPGDGLPPADIDRVIGKRLVKSLKEDDSVLIEHLAP